MQSDRLTSNQLVAWNLQRARKRRGWTQQHAAERLEPHLGERWSVAVFSAAERSLDGKRIRHFTADELCAFARTFDLPVSYFLCPPPWVRQIGHADSSETASAEEYLDLLFDLGEDAREWLLLEVVPMTGESIRALRRWGTHFAAMVAHREAEVAALAEAAGEREEQP